MNNCLIFLISVYLLFSVSCKTQKNTIVTGNKPLQNSLLWEISGNGLSQPSYLYGTIHLLCKTEAGLSDSLVGAIKKTDQVYFEVDMDNLVEMLSVFTKMKMRNDTTLADLLTREEYDKLKTWFESKNSQLPFSMIETFKPMLAASFLMVPGMDCDETVAMEQLIMQEAQKYKKKIGGLESIAFQAGLFDSIPYKWQAQQLLKYIAEEGKNAAAEDDYNKMMEAYRNQDIEKLDMLIRSQEMGLAGFEDILLYNRNRNWVKKLKTILPENSVTIAVGAGHLAGENGVISLLRKEGYILRPVFSKSLSRKVI